MAAATTTSTTNPSSYEQRRAELEEYFDRTAVDAWAKLTSEEPVGRIRASVRAGRDRMRTTLLGMLPEELRGQRVLDAGCGTGALAVEAAYRGARVVAIDLSPTLVDLARQRYGRDDDGSGIFTCEDGLGSVEFRVSDMLSPSLVDRYRFDWVVAMDSLIHYTPDDMAETLAKLARIAERGVLFTFAPRTPLLAFMHMVGRIFPRSSRAPDLEPVAEDALRSRLEQSLEGTGFVVGRTERVDTGFYMSQAMELVRP